MSTAYDSRQQDVSRSTGATNAMVESPPSFAPQGIQALIDQLGLRTGTRPWFEDPEAGAAWLAEEDEAEGVAPATAKAEDRFQGWGGQREGDADAYAYIGREDDAFSAGWGWFNAEADGGDFLHAGVRAGAWQDDERGRTYGVENEATGLTFQSPRIGDCFGFDVSLLKGGLDANVAEQGLKVGLDLTALGAGVTLQDPFFGTGLGLRAGVSMGVGAGIRGGDTDVDNDGREERGLGLSVGPGETDLWHEAAEPGPR